MDIAYLRHRAEVSRARAANALNEPARRAHAMLADLYASRIAAAEAEAAPAPPRVPPATD